jgi:outer membrane lipoprotein-sorting protein
MQPLVWVSLLTLAQTDAKEAEQLFRAMEAKIANAKALKMVCKSSVEVGANAYRVDVTLYAAAGNRLRVQAVGALRAKKDEELLVIADGKNIGVSQSPKADLAVRDLDADQNQKLLDLLVRAATGTVLDELLRPGTQPGADLVLSNFKLGAKEKVDGKREARLVEYEVGLKQKSGVLKVKLWIDTQSLLPVRRVMTITSGTTEARYTEVFSEFALDPAVDAKLFELPK